jgi:hypothetical protein
MNSLLFIKQSQQSGMLLVQHAAPKMQLHSISIHSIPYTRGFTQLVDQFRPKNSDGGTPTAATGKSEQQPAGPLNGLVALL